MRNYKLILTTIILLFSIGVNAIDHVRGNGKLTTKKINIDDYNSIRVDGVIDFTYTQSDKTPELEITLDENLHQYVFIDIDDKELIVKFTGVKVDHYTKFAITSNSKWLKKIKASGNSNIIINSSLIGDELNVEANSNCLIQARRSIQVGALDFKVAGSANVVCNSVKVDKLKCAITGSGTINLKNGSTTQSKYTITSSGEIMSYGVTATDADCKLTGNGSIELTAEKSLKAYVVGKGTIMYKGTPSVEQKVVGKGKVEKVK
jgi:hypothetical protein